MKRSYLLGIVALAIIAIIGIGTVSAFGFGNGFIGFGVSENQTEIHKEMDSINSAIRNGDYETWKSIMEERIARMQESITEENFNQIVEQYTEIQEKHEEMKENCEDDSCPEPEEGEFRPRGSHKMNFPEKNSDNEDSE